jgi:anti-sigma regulatory factor (Ser/Thr protein kinase)
MAGRVRESVTVAGRPERVALARAFVSWLLGEGHPCGDVALLLASELVTNSVRHSGSAAPGEAVTVSVTAGGGTVLVEVTDRSGDGVPHLRQAGAGAGRGRGLQLVASLAARWGCRRDGGRTTTWFELRHD